MSTAPLRIGSRSSELALCQTELAIAAITTATPGTNTEIIPINTAGDMRTDIPLCKVNKATQTQDKGVFIAALEEALAAGRIDCAVHSLKDMPGTLDERFEIAAILPRESIWDVLVIKEGANMEHLTIGTSSVRRTNLIRNYWSGTAKTVSIRGNVATRLQKLIDTPEMDAIVLARAGLNRLGYTGSIIDINGTRLHVVEMAKDSFMPAFCQGAIAIEIRKGDTATKALVAPANDPASELTVRAERAFLAELQADCSVPVGGYATCNRDLMMFRAIYYTPNGMPIRITHRGSSSTPEQVGREACAMLKQQLG